MRISDWSSDVCSSDLGAGDGGVVGRRRKGCGIVHAAIVAPDIKKARSGETVPGFCSLPHVGCGLIVKESLVPLHAAVQNRTSRYRNWPVVVGRGYAPDGFPAVRRSEEHTSELQSLMRISYAVFC